jgi:hypothetical protein
MVLEEHGLSLSEAQYLRLRTHLTRVRTLPHVRSGVSTRVTMIATHRHVVLAIDDATPQYVVGEVASNGSLIRSDYYRSAEMAVRAFLARGEECNGT